jgi:hypothetical protein
MGPGPSSSSRGGSIFNKQGNGKKVGLPVPQGSGGVNLVGMMRQATGPQTTFKGGQPKPVPWAVQDPELSADTSTSRHKRPHLINASVDAAQRSKDVFDIVQAKHGISGYVGMNQHQGLSMGDVRGQVPLDTQPQAAPESGGRHVPLGTNATIGVSGSCSPVLPRPPLRTVGRPSMPPGPRSTATTRHVSRPPGPPARANPKEVVGTPSAPHAEAMFLRERPSPEAPGPRAHSSPSGSGSQGAPVRHLFSEEVPSSSPEGESETLPGDDREAVSQLSRMFPLSEEVLYAAYREANRNIEDTVIILSNHQAAPVRTPWLRSSIMSVCRLEGLGLCPERLGCPDSGLSSGSLTVRDNLARRADERVFQVTLWCLGNSMVRTGISTYW